MESWGILWILQHYKKNAFCPRGTPLRGIVVVGSPLPPSVGSGRSLGSPCIAPLSGKNIGSARSRNPCLKAKNDLSEKWEFTDVPGALFEIYVPFAWRGIRGRSTGALSPTANDKKTPPHALRLVQTLKITRPPKNSSESWGIQRILQNL